MHLNGFRGGNAICSWAICIIFIRLTVGKVGQHADVSSAEEIWQSLWGDKIEKFAEISTTGVDDVQFQSCVTNTVSRVLKDKLFFDSTGFLIQLGKAYRKQIRESEQKNIMSVPSLTELMATLPMKWESKSLSDGKIAMILIEEIAKDLGNLYPQINFKECLNLVSVCMDVPNPSVEKLTKNDFPNFKICQKLTVAVSMRFTVDDRPGVFVVHPSKLQNNVIFIMDDKASPHTQAVTIKPKYYSVNEEPGSCLLWENRPLGYMTLKVMMTKKLSLNQADTPVYYLSRPFVDIDIIERINALTLQGEFCLLNNEWIKILEVWVNFAENYVEYLCNDLFNYPVTRICLQTLAFDVMLQDGVDEPTAVSLFINKPQTGNGINTYDLHRLGEAEKKFKTMSKTKSHPNLGFAGILYYMQRMSMDKDFVNLLKQVTRESLLAAIYTAKVRAVPAAAV